MYDWVYIATPSGADLGRTIGLADGKVFPSVGVIRRSVAPGKPHLEKLRRCHSLLLTYNLFHSGLVYPIGVFWLDEPDHPRNPRVKPYHKARFPAIGELTDPDDRRRLEPDYVATSDREHVLIGELKALEPPKEALKVYRRLAPGDNALHPWSPGGPLKEITSEEEAGILEDTLVPRGDAAKEILEQAARSGVPVRRLDGRARQLLIENRMAEQALGAESHTYALPATPLCHLAEYELQKLLARAARWRLKHRLDPALGDAVLSWIPDPTVYGFPGGFGQSIGMLEMLSGDATEQLQLDSSRYANTLDILKRIKDFRNRVVHSYFLEGSHYKRLRKLVTRLLATIYGLG